MFFGFLFLALLSITEALPPLQNLLTDLPLEVLGTIGSKLATYQEFTNLGRAFKSTITKESVYLSNIKESCGSAVFMLFVGDFEFIEKGNYDLHSYFNEPYHYGYHNNKFYINGVNEQISPYLDINDICISALLQYCRLNPNTYAFPTMDIHIKIPMNRNEFQIIATLKELKSLLSFLPMKNIIVGIQKESFDYDILLLTNALNITIDKLIDPLSSQLETLYSVSNVLAYEVDSCKTHLSRPYPTTLQTIKCHDFQIYCTYFKVMPHIAYFYINNAHINNNFLVVQQLLTKYPKLSLHIINLFTLQQQPAAEDTSRFISILPRLKSLTIFFSEQHRIQVFI